MSRVSRNLIRLFFLFIIAVLVFKPLHAEADGGPIAPYEVWTALKEGHQVAVVTIKDEDTTQIDLFISLLDKTEESHEVVFFVPLGTDAANFNVVERKITTFDRLKTTGLDNILRESETRKQQALHALFTGTLLSNGVWLIPLWAPMLLSGCGVASYEAADATFQTDSSQISIFSINDATDLEALINTAGLDVSVKETLASLRGQQIAVVNMQTHPQLGDDSGEGRRGGETGIHLGWTTSLVPGQSGGTYSYPLGTGASWSHPIEVTRVYVVAPVGIDFSVRYPALGSRRSSYEGFGYGKSITDYYHVPAYAVDDARGDFGRIWRVTYTQSNLAEDIVITARPQTALSKLRSSIEQDAPILSLAFVFIVGLALWMLAWHFLMPRLLGVESREGYRLQWYFGLIYPFINAILLVIPGSILFFFFTLGLAIPVIIFTLLFFGGVSILAFYLIHARHMVGDEGKALRSFIFTGLASNGVYLLLAFAFTKAVGII